MIKRDWVEGPKMEFLGPCKFANCHSNIVDLHYLSDKFGINLDSDDEGRIIVSYDKNIYNTPNVFIDDYIIRDDDNSPECVPYLVRFYVKESTDQLFIYRSNFSESIRIDKNSDTVVILPIADLDKLIIKMG
jgi:hypothetical protein